MVYLTWTPQLSMYKGVTQADLYLTMPVAMARLGGFIIIWWVGSAILISFFHFFNSLDDTTDALVTYNVEPNNAQPKEKAMYIVAHQGDLEYNFFQHIFCCSAEKRQMHDEAVDKVEEQMNLGFWAGAARRAEFLGKLMDNPDRLDLVKYGPEYRFEHASAQDYERKDAFCENDLKHAREMNNREDRLYQHITGDDQSRPVSGLK